MPAQPTVDQIREFVEQYRRDHGSTAGLRQDDLAQHFGFEDKEHLRTGLTQAERDPEVMMAQIHDLKLQLDARTAQVDRLITLVGDCLEKAKGWGCASEIALSILQMSPDAPRLILGTGFGLAATPTTPGKIDLGGVLPRR